MGDPLVPVKPQIPDHELLRVIGAGSYGEVWLARSVLGIYRAIKVVRRSAFTDSRPFDREFNGLKKFEPISRRHDSLLDILHVGRNDNEGYFFSIMELGDDVESGQQIDPATYQVKTLAGELARHGALPLDECARIGLGISAGLRAMHSNGLIHRDIKPANIIFINGSPKLADIGLVHSVTSVGSLVGTDGYIPPEGPGSIQADIFALGKVLYEISTGNDRQEFPALPDAIRESSNVGDFAEFNEVLARACEANRAKRYATIDDLHADLRLLEAGKSVRRLRALERRIRWVTKGATIGAAVCVLGGALAWFVYSQQTRANRARSAQATTALNYGARLMEEGNLFGALGWFADALTLLDSDRSARAVTDRTRIAAVLRAAPHLAQCWWHDAPVSHADISPDGRYIAASHDNGITTVTDRQTGSNVVSMAHPGNPEYIAARFNKAGDELLTVSGEPSVRLWSLPDGRMRRELAHARNVLAAKYNHDSTLVVTACGGGAVTIWNAKSGEIVRPLKGLNASAKTAAFSPDGKRVVAGGDEGLALVWEVSSGRVIHALRHGTWVHDVAYSADGKYIATACFDQKARIWDSATGARVSQDMPHEKGVRSVEFSPDGRYLVTTTFAQAACVWDLRSGDAAPKILRHDGMTHYARFSPEGRFVLTSAWDGSVRLWDIHRVFSTPLGKTLSADARRLWTVRDKTVVVRALESTNSIASFTLERNPTRIWFNPGGSRFVAHDGSAGAAEGYDTATGTRLGLMVPAATTKAHVVLAEAGNIACVTYSNTLEIWNPERQVLLASNRYAAPVTAVISRDGGKVAVLEGATARIIFTSGLKAALRVMSHRLPVSSAAFSPDGALLVTGCKDDAVNSGYARVWNADSGEPESEELVHADGINAVVFSPDAARIATAGEDFMARVWNWRRGTVLPPFEHKQQVFSVSFSDDGRWLVTGSLDKTARVWDIETATPVTLPLRHATAVQNAVYLPESQRVVTEMYGGNATVWDLRPATQAMSNLVAAARFLSGTDAPKNARFRAAALDTIAAYGARSTDAAEWHSFNASLAEYEQDFSAAIFHLKRLASLNGEKPALLKRLAAAEASAQQYEMARGTIQRFMASTPPAAETVAESALLSMVSDRTVKLNVAELFHDFSPANLECSACAWVAACSENTDPALIDHLRNSAKVDEVAKAALDWRAGREDAALQRLEHHSSAAATALRAIILMRAGKTEAAEDLMNEVRQWRGGATSDWRQRLCVELLQREFARTPAQERTDNESNRSE